MKEMNKNTKLYMRYMLRYFPKREEGDKSGMRHDVAIRRLVRVFKQKYYKKYKVYFDFDKVWK